MVSPHPDAPSNGFHTRFANPCAVQACANGRRTGVPGRALSAEKGTVQPAGATPSSHTAAAKVTKESEVDSRVMVAIRPESTL